MPFDVSVELRNLVVAQAVTQTQLDYLSKVVAEYIKQSDGRCDEETDDKLEAVRLMAQCVTTLEDVKEIVKELKTKEIPAIHKKNAILNAKVSTHDWLMKAALGATLIASLGAAWGPISSCNVQSNDSIDHDSTEQVSKTDR